MRKVAILGATGLIGQQFIRLLADHPRFDLDHLYASEKSAGKKVQDLWELPYFQVPSSCATKEIENIDTISDDIDIVFSALPSRIASKFEDQLRQKGVAVFSNASSHRMDRDVPILVPEVNAAHAGLVDVQRDGHNTDGFIVCNSNCSAAGSSIYLSELSKLISLNKVVITTYQALSGAGIDGVSSLDSVGNVIPFINNEEPKIVEETLKMIGELDGDQIEPYQADVIANAARVNVVDGHLEAISVFSEDECEQVNFDRLKQVVSPLDPSQYHIAPQTHLKYLEQRDRPQPIRDVYAGEPHTASGMTVFFGRLRSQHFAVSSYVLVHNTIRGGAGGSVLNAEFLLNEGYL